MAIFKTSTTAVAMPSADAGGMAEAHRFGDRVAADMSSSDTGVRPGDTAEAVVRRSPVHRWLELLGHWFDVVLRHPVIALIMIGLFSGTSLATLDLTDIYFSSDNFCATTCHAMKSTVYPELQQSKHWTTPTGVRASCANCHVSGRLTLAMWDHFIATRDLYAQLTNDFTVPETFEKLRPAAAEKARLEMLNNDSRTCRSCHVFEAIQPQRNRGKKLHADGLKTGATCIECHYNLVHKPVEPSEKFLKAIEAKYKK